jgi:pyruvate ferredoxin oxidoreductase alpha subunit
MSDLKVLDGNRTLAEAVIQIKPDVVSTYPADPSNPSVAAIAAAIANGRLDSELINADSPYSAMSGCVGASAAGARVLSVTASQGLAMMHEMLHVTAGLRLPVVLGVVSASLAAPACRHADHSDIMAQRDCGWIQLLAANTQEVYDNIIQAFRIAEHKDVMTPVMCGMDALITSHTYENVLLENGDEVLDFVGQRPFDHSILDVDNPQAIGSSVGSDYFFEHKINQNQGIENSRRVIREVGKEFGDCFGRYYGYFESYRMEDAEFALLLMGSACGTAKECVDQLRQEGEKVGMLKIRTYRPFPALELREAVAGLKAIAVLDRFFSPGSSGGALFQEISTVLYQLEKPPRLYPFVYGLGGRDIQTVHFERVVAEIKAGHDDEGSAPLTYINLRE